MIYAGTFSKVLAPAIRLGYLVAPSSLMPLLRRLRAHVDRHPPIDSRAVLARFIDEGHFGGHVRRMRLLYRERRDALVMALTEVLPDFAALPAPSSGMHLMFPLPLEIADTEVSERVRNIGISCPPLTAYCQMPTARNGLLLGLASLDPALAPSVAGQLRDAITELCARH